MSHAGVIGPLRLKRQDAAVVARIIEERTSQAVLDGTPLAKLGGFGRKLSAATKRRRASGSELGVWNIEREEAVAGFHYLALFTHPKVPGSFLSEAESISVREVALAIAAQLLARRGPKRLTRAEIE